MRLNIYIIVVWFLLSCTLEIKILNSQTGTGSSNLHSSLFLEAGSSVTDLAETLYLGPGTFTINGTWDIYSKYFWIHPSANISGTGTIVLHNPGSNSFYPGMTGPLTLDHNNGVPIDLMIGHNSVTNVVLGDVADVAYSTTNPSGSSAAALKLAKGMNLMVNGGDVILNGNDLILSNNAVINNGSANRMIVTGNSLTAHVIKNNTASNTFLFPIGIAEGDYTPVTITGSNNYHVSVVDYSVGPPANPDVGMNRTWNIFGGAATALTLQHNMATDGLNFNDNLAFITQNMTNISPVTWSVGTGSDMVSPGVHSNSALAATIPATSNATSAFFSKSSDDVVSLPILLKDFSVRNSNCNNTVEWITSAEINNAYFEVYRSKDGVNWELVYTTNGALNSNELKSYSFVDNAINEAGVYYYYLKQIDVNGRSEVFDIKSTFANICLESLSLFPNPTADFVNIKWDKSNLSIDGYKVIDIAGRTLTLNPIINNSGLEKVDLRSFSDGTYFITLMSNKEEIKTEKFIVIR